MSSNPTDSTTGTGSAPAAPAAAAEASEDLGGVDFETAIQELEALVDRMEAGDLTLEASLVAYERGVKLARHCQAALRNAELKIKKLTEDDQLEPVDLDTFDDH